MADITLTLTEEEIGEAMRAWVMLNGYKPTDHFQVLGETTCAAAPNAPATSRILIKGITLASQESTNEEPLT